MTKALKNYEKAYKDWKKGMTYKEIAKKYNTTDNTVKSWKRRHFGRLEEEERAEAKRKEEVAANAHKLNYLQAAGLIQEAAERAESGKGINSTVDSQSVTTLKELVEVKRTGRPPAYSAKDTGKMISRIGEYFNRQAEEGKPCTKAGLILALGINKDTYYTYLRGEMDYLLEEHLIVNHIDIRECKKIRLDDGSEMPVDDAGNPLIPYSEILQKAVLRLEEQAEERLYSKARPGDIFTLKQYGWTDERSPGTVNNTLVIASAEESDRALRMLYGDK